MTYLKKVNPIKIFHRLKKVNPIKIFQLTVKERMEYHELLKKLDFFNWLKMLKYFCIPIYMYYLKKVNPPHFSTHRNGVP